jgi:hypothetical protein
MVSASAGLRPINGLASLFASILRCCNRPGDAVVPNYEEHGWCDSIERQLITDGTTCRSVHILKWVSSGIRIT